MFLSKGNENSLTYIVNCNSFILFEDIPLCYNYNKKNKYFVTSKTQQYYIIIGILLWKRDSVFLKTFFRLKFLSNRYNTQYALIGNLLMNAGLKTA